MEHECEFVPRHCITAHFLAYVSVWLPALFFTPNQEHDFELILRHCTTAPLLMVEFGDKLSNRFGNSMAATHPLNFCCQHCDVTYSDMFLLESNPMLSGYASSSNVVALFCAWHESGVPHDLAKPDITDCRQLLLGLVCRQLIKSTYMYLSSPCQDCSCVW